MSFKVGDIVRLKSGGPKMTVTLEHKIVPTHNSDLLDTVWCMYFDKNDRSRAKSFHPDTLVLVDPDVP